MILSKEHQNQYEVIIKRLKDKGLRMTEVRALVIKIIIGQGHPTIQQVIEKMKEFEKNVNVMSVYNTLDLLLENHVIFANTFNGKQICYEIMTPVLFHSKCDRCQKVVHIEKEKLLPSNFESIIELTKTFSNMTTEHIKIEAHGFCQECLETINN